MTSTTTASAQCNYCFGGSLYGGSTYAARRTCAVCKGSGRLPAKVCATCSAPLLDGQAKRWGARSEAFHKDC